MKSFRQMTADGMLKRADAEKIRIEDIHEEPGFNAPGRSDSNDDDDEALFQYVMSGGALPSLEVRPREEGGVFIVDGHRRTKAIRRAVAAGLPMQDKAGAVWVSIRQFVGNDLDRKLRVITSNEGKKLTPLQLGHVYRDANVWASVADIARRVNKSDTHVSSCIALANGNSDVHAMVQAGDVSATLAGAVVREHGEAAGAILATAKVKAQAAGKKRVTAAALGKKPKPFTHPSLVHTQHKMGDVSVTLFFSDCDEAFTFFKSVKGK